MPENHRSEQASPFFSVVIPVHNKGPHIRRCLSSVLDQTCKDYEILIIDDASTDHSLSEIKEFTHRRIRLFRRYTPGPGGYAARNLGIKNARGQWIAFLDADDQWHAGHLEQMKNLALQYPQTSFMSCGWEKEIEGKKSPNPFYTRFHSQGNQCISLKDYLIAAVNNMLPVCTLVACVRKDSPLMDDLFPAETEAKRGGDIHTWLKIMCYHKKMAWSNHLGAVYHTDSCNMVTKSAETGTTLLQPKIYHQLAKNLRKDEKTLLTKYMNVRLKKSLVTSIRINQRKHKYRNSIYWKGDVINALKLFLWSLIPPSLLHFVYSKTRSKKHLP